MLSFVMVVPSFGIMHFRGGVVIVGLSSLAGVVVEGGVGYARGLFVCSSCSLVLALYVAIE